MGAVRITAHLRNASEIMELLLAVNAIDHDMPPSVPLYLVCPYLPYARQDRVCSPREAFALETMCAIINGCQFDSVTVWDVHSRVATGLLEDCINIPAADLIFDDLMYGSVLVAPDAGAVDRVLECATKFKRPMVQAEKIRDPNDGKITGTKVYSHHVGGCNFLIIDDICDGGRTFIELAKVLRPLTRGKIKLWVTHGIFSQGFEVFKGLIDEIYTANCFQEYGVPWNVHIGHKAV